jgi:hypothetical protein
MNYLAYIQHRDIIVIPPAAWYKEYMGQKPKEITNGSNSSTYDRLVNSTDDDDLRLLAIINLYMGITNDNSRS